MKEEPLSPIERDLVVLFNTLWYRDFPYTHDRIDEKRVRAMYTAHINGIVKACADLMGFFTVFEHGQRTDAIIKNAKDDSVAKIEIEWAQPFREKVNEIEKLSKAAQSSESHAYIFVGYSDVKRRAQNIQALKDRWKVNSTHLIVFLINFDLVRDRRHLRDIETCVVQDGNIAVVRTQPALPWNAPNTRWSLAINREAVEG